MFFSSAHAGLQFNTRFSFTSLQRLRSLQSDRLCFVTTVRVASGKFFDLRNGSLDTVFVMIPASDCSGDFVVSL